MINHVENYFRPDNPAKCNYQSAARGFGLLRWAVRNTCMIAGLAFPTLAISPLPNWNRIAIRLQLGLGANGRPQLQVSNFCLSNDIGWTMPGLLSGLIFGINIGIIIGINIRD